MTFLKRLLRSKATELTPTQSLAQASIAFSQLPGFAPPLPGTYATYRRMSAHPTLALARSIVTAPILASAWSCETCLPGGLPTRRGPLTDGVATDPIDRQ